MIGRRIAVLLLAVPLGSGCGWWGERSNTTKGAVYGTGVGAAAGAAIGGILGGGRGAATGAAVGAAVGALGGTGVGYYMDRQAKEMQAILDQQDRLEREGETLHASLSSDVLFDSGSASLRPGGVDKLRQVARILTRYPRTNVEIVGHTDNRGSETSNQELSEQRAEAVRSVLVQQGVDAARIGTQGMGEIRPVASNETSSGRAMNRRVEITVAPTANAGTGPTRGAPPPAPPPDEEPR